MRRWPLSNWWIAPKLPRRWKTPAPSKQGQTPSAAGATESQAPAWLFFFGRTDMAEQAVRRRCPVEGFCMPDPVILSVSDLRKSYGANASRSMVVDGLSFALRRGECYG